MNRVLARLGSIDKSQLSVLPTKSEMSSHLSHHKPSSLSATGSSKEGLVDNALQMALKNISSQYPVEKCRYVRIPVNFVCVYVHFCWFIVDI